ncbi:MAG: c-type cytochrome [Alphaproteobacteria bacterium]|nr:c-type cytochrome [Alphaproteobacteria bacterium]
MSGGWALAQDSGEYLFRAGGCWACHTDIKGGGPPLAGGRPLKTPFGIFYSPNITPDPDTGIGRWTVADFKRAMREGVRPDGAHYFPVFPYTTYSRMTDDDIGRLWAYLKSQPAVSRPNRLHDVAWPFSMRLLQGGWKLMFFSSGAYRAQPARGAEWNRGAYLVEALTHCGECHTPRNAMGGMDMGRWMAGTRDGPEGERAPNITPDKATGIGDWSVGDIVELLKTGTKPDFDNIQGTMEEAVQHSLKYLTEADHKAIAAYFKALPAVVNKVPSGTAK